MNRLWWMAFLAVGMFCPVLVAGEEPAKQPSPLLTLPSTVSGDSLSTAPVRLVDTQVVIPKLDFSGVPLVDALGAISRAYKLSLFVDSTVTGSLSLRLENVSLNDALLFIVKQHNLSWERTGKVLKLFKVSSPPPTPKPLSITFQDSLLSCDLQSVDVREFVRTVTQVTSRNLVLQTGSSGTISGTIVLLPLDKALEALLGANGFTLTKGDNVLYVTQRTDSKSSGGSIRTLDVKCEEGMVTMNVANASLMDVINNIGRSCNTSLLLQSNLDGTVSASFSGKTVDEALLIVLSNTPYTFKEQSGIIFVGSRESEELFVPLLIKLQHVIAATVEPLIPASLSKLVSIKLVKEHNGLIVTGPRTSIARLEAFIKEVDVPTPQVLFEVLVVDYTTTDRAEFGITANNFGRDSGAIFYPNVDISGTGSELNRDLSSLSRHLGIANLGKLPSDFFVRLQAMAQQGKANIHSHPQIASLNGHTASIKIGTTQYFLLKSTTIYPSQQTSVSTQESERFEKIEADMSLEVTPFVNPNGELTVDVNPAFNTPAQAFNSKTPPTINRRELHSTVRLRDGETIVLGGLVQTSKSTTIDKFPILGSIPLLGRLFQNRTSTNINSELIIYVTPHVYYGSEGSVDLTEIMKHK